MSKQKEGNKKSDKTTAAKTPKEKKAMKTLKKQGQNDYGNATIKNDDHSK